MVNKEVLKIGFHVLINVLLIAGGLNWLYVAIQGEDFLDTYIGVEAAKGVKATVGAAAIIKLVYQVMYIVALHKSGRII